MKRLAVSVVAFAGLAGSALAADLPARPVYKAPPADPAYSWTGCYVAAGYGSGIWNQDNTTVATATGVPQSVTMTMGGNGWFGTVQAGCDYQFNGRWVAGVFGDYDFGRLAGETTVPGQAFAGTEKLTSAWAIGGRFGYLPTARLLTYLSAGYTQAHFDRVGLHLTAAGPTPITNYLPAHTYGGWFVGAGFEYALSWLPGLFWKTEYRLADYGADRLGVFTLAGVPTGFSVDAKKVVQTVRSELVWRFNLGAPASAQAFDNAPAGPAPSWTGCYVGAGVGGGIWNQEVQTFFGGVPASTQLTMGGRGWLGSVQGGCDYQVSRRFVAGAFVDFDFSGLTGSLTEPNIALVGDETLSRSWAAGGRVGYLPFQRLMTYIAAGYAQAHFNQVNLHAVAAGGGPITNYIPAQDYGGWFFGSGYEYALAVVPGLFWKTEYRVASYDRGRLTDFLVGGAPSGRSVDSKKIVQTVRTALVWRFGWAHN